MHSAWFSRIFLFNHPVRHFFSNTTQIPHSSFYPWITHPIQYHWTHGNMPIPISRLKMWNRFILDIQEEPFPAIYHAPKPKFLPSGPTLMGLWGSTTFVLFSRKWITKCWQVWPCKKLIQVNLFHSNSLLVKQRFPFLSKSLISQNILEFCYTLEQEMTDKRNDCKKCM